MTSLNSWYDTMVRLRQEDLPWVSVNGNFLTPNSIVAHANLNDNVWNAVMNNNYTIPDTLCQERIAKMYEKSMLATIHYLGEPYKLTPAEQVQESMAKSPIGIELIDTQRMFIEELTP